MSEFLEFLFSEPKLLMVIAIAVMLAVLVSSWLGIVAGLVAFAAAVVSLCLFAMVRSVSRR